MITRYDSEVEDITFEEPDALDAWLNSKLASMGGGASVMPDGFIDYDEYGNAFRWQAGKRVAAPDLPPRPNSAAAQAAAGPAGPKLVYNGRLAYMEQPDGTRVRSEKDDLPQEAAGSASLTAPNVTNVAAPRVPTGQLTQEQVSAIPGIKQEGPGQFIFPLGDGNWQRLRVNDYDAGRFDYFNAPFKPAAESGTANTYSRQTTGGKTYVIHNQSQKVAAEIVNGQTIPRNGYTFAGNALVPPGSMAPTKPAVTAPATISSSGAAAQPAPQLDPVEGTGRDYSFETPGGGSGSTRFDPATNVSVGESSGAEYKDPWVDPNIAGNKLAAGTSSRGRIGQLRQAGYFDLPNPNAREPMVNMLQPPNPLLPQEEPPLLDPITGEPITPFAQGGEVNVDDRQDIGPGTLNFYRSRNRLSRPIAGNPRAFIDPSSASSQNLLRPNPPRVPFQQGAPEVMTRSPALVTDLATMDPIAMISENGNAVNPQWERLSFPGPGQMSVRPQGGPPWGRGRGRGPVRQYGDVMSRIYPWLRPLGTGLA